MSWLWPGIIAGTCFPCEPTVPTQLVRLNDSTQASAKEESGEGLTEKSPLWPVGGLWVEVQYWLSLMLLSWGFIG